MTRPAAALENILVMTATDVITFALKNRNPELSACDLYTVSSHAWAISGSE